MDRFSSATLEVHRVEPGGHGLRAFAHDGLGQNGGGRRAVAGQVVGLGGDFAHHLGAHVLELVLKLDFLGNGHAVLRGARSAEGLVEHDVTAFRAERLLDGVGENVDAGCHALAGVVGKTDFFSHY